MTTPALHTREIGEIGPGTRSVVFLHGLFGQGRNFTAAAKALAPGLASVLVDLPNHGHSPWIGEAGYLAVADAVAPVLAGLRDRTGAAPHLVGHSMGGKVAMVLALRRPELVDRLVVVDIAPAVSEGAGEFEHLLDSLARLDLAAVQRRSDADDALRADIPDDRVRGFLLQNLRPRSGADADAAGGGFGWQADLALLRRSLPEIGGFPDLTGLPPFDRPVLWLAGARSRYVGPEHDATMRALFPRTTLVTVKNAGHWLHADQPEAFASALRVFLRAG